MREGRDIRPFMDDRGPHRGGDRDMYWPPAQRHPRDTSPQFEVGNTREPTPPWQYEERLPSSDDRAGLWNRNGRVGRASSPPKQHRQLDDLPNVDIALTTAGGSGFVRDPTSFELGIPPGANHAGPRLGHAASQSSLSSAAGPGPGPGPQRTAPSLKAFMTSRDVSMPSVGGLGAGAASGAVGPIIKVHDNLSRLEPSGNFGYGQRSQQTQPTEIMPAPMPSLTAQGLSSSRSGFGVGRYVPEPSSSHLPSVSSLKHLNNDYTSIPSLPSIRVMPSSSLLRAESNDFLSPQTSDAAAAGGILSPAGGGRRFGFGISRRASTQPTKGSGGDASAGGEDVEDAALCQAEAKEEGDEESDGGDVGPHVETAPPVDPTLGVGSLAEGVGDSAAIAFKGEDELDLTRVSAADLIDVVKAEGAKSNDDDHAGEARQGQQSRQHPPALGMDEISAQIELLETEISDLEKLTTSLQISGKQV